MNTNTRHWSDAYANAADLADALVALNIVSMRPGVAAAIRNGGKGCAPDTLDRLADDCDELGALVAKRGMYDAFVIVTDAAAALRELAAGDVETWGDDSMTVEVMTLRPVEVHGTYIEPGSKLDKLMGYSDGPKSWPDAPPVVIFGVDSKMHAGYTDVVREPDVCAVCNGVGCSSCTDDDGLPL